MRGKYLIDDGKFELPKGVYELEIDLMHGDADGYSTLKLQFSDGELVASKDKTKKASINEKGMLLATLDILDQLKNVYCDKYHTIDGFDELLREDWDRDSTCEDYLASFDGYKLLHYTAWGSVMNVVIENHGW